MRNDKVIVFGVCILLTIFSIAIRFESLFTDRPFDYEWHTSTVLRHLTIWHEEGGFRNHFVPSVSYGGSSDKHINNHSSIEEGRMGYGNEAGDFYYVSYPPFAYIAPYAVFTMLDVAPNIVGLRLFNVAVQIVTAGLLLLLVYRLTRDPYAALAAYALYLFSGISLYMHTVNYMSDMFVQCLFVLGAYLFYRIISGVDKEKERLYYGGLALCLSLAVYSEWIGLFICGFIFLYALLFRTRGFSRPLLLMSAIIPSVVVLGVVVQYASVADLQTFLAVMSDRYLHGYVPAESEAATVPSLLKALGLNYLKWFSPVFFLTALLCALWLLGKRAVTGESSPPRDMRLPSVLAFLIVPVILHHGIFLDWSAFEIHFFSVLKTVPFFCVLVPVLMHQVWTRRTLIYPWVMHGVVWILFVAVIGSSVFIYAGDLRTRSGPDKFEDCNLGDAIRERTADDEVAFITPVSADRFNNIISSVLILCAHRNVALYTTKEAANELMRKNGTTKGVIFTIDYNETVIEFVKSQKIHIE